MLISSLLLIQPVRPLQAGVKYFHHPTAIVYSMPQELELEINCLMTAKDLNIMKGMDEEDRLDWLF